MTMSRNRVMEFTVRRRGPLAARMTDQTYTLTRARTVPKVGSSSPTIVFAVNHLFQNDRACRLKSTDEYASFAIRWATTCGYPLICRWSNGSGPQDGWRCSGGSRSIILAHAHAGSRLNAWHRS